MSRDTAPCLALAPSDGLPGEAAAVDVRAIGKEREQDGEIFGMGAATEFHAHVAQFDDAIRELRRRGDNQLDVELRLRRFLRGHFEIAFHAVHRFRPARARRFSHPFQFAF